MRRIVAIALGVFCVSVVPAHSQPPLDLSSFMTSPAMNYHPEISNYQPQWQVNRAVTQQREPSVENSLRRAVVDYPSLSAGTIYIDTARYRLYYGLGDGKAMRYGIGVGRDGFRWKGTEQVSAKKEWPTWTPPPEMIVRQPYLPRLMAGGPGNPLGARALYLGSTEYRIHGTNDPTTIGKNVSSGCIRLTNDDVIDLYQRVQLGALVRVQ